MANITKIVDELSTLTVMEASELSKLLEEKWGVSAAAPMAVASASSADADAPAEKTHFDVMLTSIGDKKIEVIKTVREITGLGLKEAKALVDGAPSSLKSGVEKSESDEIKAKIEAAGATVEIK